MVPMVVEVLYQAQQALAQQAQLLDATADTEEAVRGESSAVQQRAVRLHHRHHAAPVLLAGRCERHLHLEEGEAVVFHAERRRERRDAVDGAVSRRGRSTQASRSGSGSTTWAGRSD